jgi:hypothetical protein
MITVFTGIIRAFFLPKKIVSEFCMKYENSAFRSVVCYNVRLRRKCVVVTWYGDLRLHTPLYDSLVTCSLKRISKAV